MASVLILGSGPSAAAAALALAARTDHQITVIDVGVELEPNRKAALDELAAEVPARWKPSALQLVAGRPVRSSTAGLPEKRAYGSDYPLRDAGQRRGLRPAGGVPEQLISGAYGGFSAVWGAVVLPFPAGEFAGWPFGSDEMAAHYGAVLSAIPYAAEEDDLVQELPIYAGHAPAPDLSERGRLVYQRYQRNRGQLRREGLVMGRARLAVRTDACVRCAMCMTGCPYGLIYSAAQTFDALRQRGRITYHSNLLALRLEERGERAVVTACDLRAGSVHRFEGDRVFVACGAIGTTRLVLSSLNHFGTSVSLQESVQFMVPFVSRQPTADPKMEAANVLAQLCAVLHLPDVVEDAVHLQLYSYNSAFDDALPRWIGPLSDPALRRLTVGLGYLPSSVSPRLEVRLAGPSNDGGLPEMVVGGERSIRRNPPVMRAVARLLRRAAPRLDLWPILPRLMMSAPGKSYHWGGSFPHSATRTSPFATDRVGRLAAWNRIHLVDASVLPSIASTTFTLTAMANAHRIATEAMEAA